MLSVKHTGHLKTNPNKTHHPARMHPGERVSQRISSGGPLGRKKAIGGEQRESPKGKRKNLRLSFLCTTGEHLVSCGFERASGAGLADGYCVACGGRKSRVWVTFQGPSLVLRNPKTADFALHKVGSLGWKSVYCVYGGWGRSCVSF